MSGLVRRRADPQVKPNFKEDCHVTYLHFRLVYWPWPDGG
jgi:hypothetical protein